MGLDASVLPCEVVLVFLTKGMKPGFGNGGCQLFFPKLQRLPACQSKTGKTILTLRILAGERHSAGECSNGRGKIILTLLCIL